MKKSELVQHLLNLQDKIIAIEDAVVKEHRKQIIQKHAEYHAWPPFDHSLRYLFNHAPFRTERQMQILSKDELSDLIYDFKNVKKDVEATYQKIKFYATEEYKSAKKAKDEKIAQLYSQIDSLVNDFINDVLGDEWSCKFNGNYHKVTFILADNENYKFDITWGWFLNSDKEKTFDSDINIWSQIHKLNLKDKETLGYKYYTGFGKVLCSPLLDNLLSSAESILSEAFDIESEFTAFINNSIK